MNFSDMLLKSSLVYIVKIARLCPAAIAIDNSSILFDINYIVFIMLHSLNCVNVINLVNVVNIINVVNVIKPTDQRTSQPTDKDKDNNKFTRYALNDKLCKRFICIKVLSL